MRILLRLLPILALASSPLFAQIRFEPVWRELGPANMSGRIVDLAVDPRNKATWYAATASGGVYKTTTAGTRWDPIFERANSASVGAIAISPTRPDTIWVGTGECNPRNSVSWGDGVYVSKDGGKTFEHTGLDKTFQIGRIVVHPENADTVFVAACGRLWGPNGERGIYRTRDGGKQWELVLKVDDRTGAIDVVIDPANPDRVYAATYQRMRDGFDGGDPVERWGAGSGLWRSVDGGKTWKRLAEGLPTVAVGRVGLAIAASEPNVIYAVVETERSGWATGTEKAPMNGNGKPHAGYGTRLGGQVHNVEDKQGPAGFETGGVFRSEDAGESWQRVNSLAPRPFYFSQMRVDPSDAKHVFVLGIHYYESKDGGEEFELRNQHGIHVDFHALWIDRDNPKHFLLGGDGGLAETWDGGASFRFFDNLPCAQFYHVAVDNRDPYHIYGGLQDNGTWGMPSRTRFADGVLPGDVYKFGMGDGFRVVAHPEAEGLVYHTSQFGRIGLYNLLTGKQSPVRRPKAPKGVSFRFNWDTPFDLDPNDPDQLWFAGNYVFLSKDGGKTSHAVSHAISATDRGTATALTISKKSRGTVYVGTDDGALWLGRGNGKTWKDLTQRLPKAPKGRFIGSLQASSHKSGTVYLAFDGHRSDDMEPHAYVSGNHGGSWSEISRGIARGPVRVLREDAKNPDLLFAGTEFGFYVSLDRGERWLDFRGNLPTVAVHDLAIQQREQELVIATHGRGLWSVDISALRGCTASVQRKAVALLEPRAAKRHTYLPRRMPVGQSVSRFANPRDGVNLAYWIKRGLDTPPTLEILNAKQETVHTLPTSGEGGLHQVFWDLRLPKKRGRATVVPAGKYTVRLVAGKASLTEALEITGE